MSKNASKKSLAGTRIAALFTDGYYAPAAIQVRLWRFIVDMPKWYHVIGAAMHCVQVV